MTMISLASSQFSYVIASRRPVSCSPSVTPVPPPSAAGFFRRDTQNYAGRITQFETDRVSETRQRLASDTGIQLLSCRRSSGVDLIGCSSTPETETSRDTCMLSGTRIWPRSGLIRFGWLKAAGLGRAEIQRVEALVRDNAIRLRGAWDEYFTE